MSSATPEPDELPSLFEAGRATTDLLAAPKRWINRRVETIEMLSKEETRRRVSIDFTLTRPQLTALRIEDGIVVPVKSREVV